LLLYYCAGCYIGGKPQRRRGKSGEKKTEKNWNKAMRKEIKESPYSMIIKRIV
jgi:hypothetical protein